MQKMKIAIVYWSKNGTTEKAANIIGDKLSDNEVDLFDLQIDPDPDVSGYDMVIIGGPIYFGMMQNPVKMFCKHNEKLLLEKEIGLFICSISREQDEAQFENAFSVKIRNHSRANACLGGELIFEKLNFFEKLMVWKVAESHLEFHIDQLETDTFVEKLYAVIANYCIV